MKLFAKIGLAVLVTGVAATMYAAPNDTLTPATDADGIRDQARADLKHVRNLKQVAQKSKDVIKLNCVNDKLVQMNPLVNLTDKKYQAWKDASTDKDAKLSDLAKDGESVRRLRSEADQCVGETNVSESQQSWSGPDVPDDPTKGNPFDPPNPPIEPPGYASPFN